MARAIGKPRNGLFVFSLAELLCRMTSFALIKRAFGSENKSLFVNALFWNIFSNDISLILGPFSKGKFDFTVCFSFNSRTWVVEICVSKILQVCQLKKLIYLTLTKSG